MIHVHSKGRPIYGRLTIDHLNLDWPLPVQNRKEGEAYVTPAVAARKSVKKAADDWRKCAIGSCEAEVAARTLLRAQHQLRDTLAAVGAKYSKNWAKAIPEFDKLPLDETPGSDHYLDRFGSRSPKAAATALWPAASASRAEQKAMREASLKKTEERYFQLIEAQPDGAPEPRALLEKKMMDEFKVTRREARDCRAKAIHRYASVTGKTCEWGESGRRR